MKPIGPLMVEHRLIERMVGLLDAELRHMKNAAEVDTHLVSVGVDFFRTYADKTHHGKEEDILFKELADKSLSDEEQQMMQCLIQEHIWARQAVGQLAAANDRYRRGEIAALETIIYELGRIVEFYPRHIEKEDKHFFIPVMDYFSEAEQQAMLDRFWEFDRRMIHEKYRRVVEEEEAVSVGDHEHVKSKG
jgi:hemerythrin-like domain-containing protein